MKHAVYTERGGNMLNCTAGSKSPDTAWKSFKGGNVVLSVSQAYGKTAYILAVDSDGDTVATDGFSRSLFALQFGDFLWDNVLSGRPQVDASVVQQTRDEWERFRALGPGR